MYGWHYQAMGGGWWVMMFIGMVIFGGTFAFGIISLLRHDHAGPAKFGLLHQDSAAIEVLKERLARGELSEEDYARRLNLLKEKP